MPWEHRETGYQALDVLVQLLSNEDLKKVVEITYTQHKNATMEV